MPMTQQTEPGQVREPSPGRCARRSLPGAHRISARVIINICRSDPLKQVADLATPCLILSTCNAVKTSVLCASSRFFGELLSFLVVGGIVEWTFLPELALMVFAKCFLITDDLRIQYPLHWRRNNRSCTGGMAARIHTFFDDSRSDTEPINHRNNLLTFDRYLSIIDI